MKGSQSFYARYGKRVLDVFLSLVALILLMPVLIGLWITSMAKIGRPVLFRQKRPGRKAEVFEMMKFRTMRDDRGPDGELLPDDQRLIPYGRFLRSSSLDELPEIFNVLKGEMSLVGPRPLLIRYLERYSPQQARRHEARPGITGWAQVNGRNAISWEQKFEFDVWYVDNVSLWLDLKIIGMTFQKVLKRSDISADSHATMPEFMGKQD
jgi:lipopolysaccharide/colanic/teichoic acid biosynthesis glycosyltransferase